MCKTVKGKKKKQTSYSIILEMQNEIFLDRNTLN